MLTSDRIIAKKNADQKPVTSNPSTRSAAPHTRNPLMTRENNPMVKMLIGRVRIKIIGLMRMLIIANTTARTSAPTNVTLTPGKRYAVIPIAIADTIHCVSVFMLKVYAIQ